MITIAGGIILAVILLVVFGVLVAAMFSGFQRGKAMGCVTMVVFGFILLALGIML